VKWRQRRHTVRVGYRLGPKYRTFADGTRRRPVIGYVSGPDELMRDGYRLSAVLVRSVRTPAGPRQRHVAYLGSFDEDEGDAAGFWASAGRALDRLGLAGQERARIEAALEAKVPRPGAAEPEAASPALADAAGRIKSSGPISARSLRRLNFVMMYREAIEAERAGKRRGGEPPADATGQL
jgi:hypothetical protein